MTVHHARFIAASCIRTRIAAVGHAKCYESVTTTRTRPPLPTLRFVLQTAPTLLSRGIEILFVTIKSGGNCEVKSRKTGTFFNILGAHDKRFAFGASKPNQSAFVRSMLFLAYRPCLKANV